jgi:predicted  nucleic acid-binding Zn-ribbon protein
MSLLGKRDPRVETLQDTLHDVLQRLKHLEDLHLSLEERYERLRGKFYALRSLDSPPPTESKAEILRKMGFMGRGRVE